MCRYKLKQNRNTKVCSCIHIPCPASSPQMPCPILSNYLSCKPHPGLNIYKSNELEFTFIGIINPKISNIIVGSVYKHPSVDLTDYNINYLNNRLDKVSKERKTIICIRWF